MKNSFSRLLIAAAICSLMTACGDTKPNNNTQPTPASDTATTNTTVSAVAEPPALPDDAPVINVVTTGKTLPFSFTNTDGSVTGMDAEVITRIGQLQGFKVQFHKKPWQNLFSSIESHQYDLAISGISYTPERAEKYALSESYALNPSTLMFTDSTLSEKITSLNSLANMPDLKIGVLEGSKHAKQLADAGVSNVKNYKTTYLLFTGLLRKDSDVIAQDGLLLHQLAKEHPEPKTYTFAYENEQEPSAQLVMAMAKDNTQLHESVNQGLAKMKEDGSLQAIQNKWIKD